MKYRLCLLSAAFVVFFQIEASSTWVVNGTKVKAGKFDEVVRIFGESGACTASIVGPRTIVTAAHCGKTGEIAEFEFKGRSYEAVLTRSPAYLTHDLDLGVGLLSKDIVDANPMTIGGDAKLGLAVSVLGYGCTETPEEPEEEDDDSPFPWSWDLRPLQRGESIIASFRHADMVLKQPGGSALCYGDSGGPMILESKSGVVILGINSKGNLKDISYGLRLDLPESKKFLMKIGKDHGVEICGINKLCKSAPTK